MTAPADLSPLDTWSLDREIVLTRVYAHPREAVFAAWMSEAALAAWFGPEGLAIESQSADIRQGGHWRFDMVGTFEGKEQRFANLMRFLEIVPNERIVLDHGTPGPSPDSDFGSLADDADRFRLTVTFDSQDDGKTVLTLRQLHPSAARRQAVVGFGAVEYGLQTLGKLAAYLAH